MHENGAGRNVPLDAPQIVLGRGGQTSPDSRGRAGRGLAGAFSNWRVVAAFVLAAVTLVGSVLLAIPIADPQGPLGASSPLAWVHDARADRLLSKANPTPADLRQAEAESWTALSQAPVDDAAWLALASVDRLRHGRLTADGLKWLRRSYDVAPFGPDTSAWRIRFALDNWASLTPELRGEVIQEIEVYAPLHGQKFQQIREQINDPAGRLAAAMISSLLQLRLQQAKTP